MTPDDGSVGRRLKVDHAAERDVPLQLREGGKGSRGLVNRRLPVRYGLKVRRLRRTKCLEVNLIRVVGDTPEAHAVLARRMNLGNPPEAPRRVDASKKSHEIADMI